MTDIRVLMCGSDLSIKGGITSVCKQLLQHAWDNDIHINYVPTYKDLPLLDKIQFYNRGLHIIKATLASGNADIVHIHMSFNGSFFRKLLVERSCKKYDVPVVLHMHGSEFKSFYNRCPNFVRRQIQDMLQEVDVVLALGETWKDYFKQIAPEANVLVCPNAVPFAGVKKRSRKNIFTVVYLGKLIARKGVSDLIDAFGAFLSDCEHDQIRLIVAGDGPEEMPLRAKVFEMGLTSNVVFAGWVDAEGRHRLLDEADCFVLPSYNEGLPMSMLEAMAAGVPPLVTDVGSISEVLADGENGIMFKPGDVSTLTKGLERMYSDYDFWSKCSLSAMLSVEERYDERRLFAQLASIYRDLVGQN